MSTNADKFIISRKRKKYKFAKFDEFENCSHLDEWKQSTRIDASDNLILEIGAGSALFSVELARQNPKNFYIAIDIKGDRLYRGARHAIDNQINNIVFVRSEISHLIEIVQGNSVDEIWITFPDPHANEDQTRLTTTGERRRLTAPRYLELYKKVLKPNGILHFKTDNQPLFDWSVEQFNDNGWKVAAITRDLHSSDLSDDYKIMTSYEEKFVKEGKPIYHLDAI